MIISAMIFFADAGNRVLAGLVPFGLDGLGVTDLEVAGETEASLFVFAFFKGGVKGSEEVGGSASNDDESEEEEGER